MSTLPGRECSFIRRNFDVSGRRTYVEKQLTYCRMCVITEEQGLGRKHIDMTHLKDY